MIVETFEREERSLPFFLSRLGYRVFLACFRGNIGRTGYQPVSYTTVEDNQVSDMPVTLLRNYPNPFNPSTTIKFSLKKADKVTFAIYNIKGQKVKTLLNEPLSPGTHSTVWNGLNDNNHEVSSGIYFYKIRTSSYTSVKKMILMN